MKRTKSLITAALLVAALWLSACSAASTPAPTPTPTLDPSVSRGMELFSGAGRCATCHAITEGTTIVGPSLAGIASRAATRVSGLDAAGYIEESILRPDRFKAPGFENVQMDATLGKTLTSEQVTDLVAYLLTLK